MNKSEQINELATALHKAQSKLDNASKSTQGHGYKYADLAEILDILTPVFAEYGLAQIQIPVIQDGQACLETVIMHTSGQWISGTALMAHAKLARGNDAQMMGATIAYQRRYSLKAMVGIAEQDEEKNFKENKGKAEKKIEVVREKASMSIKQACERLGQCSDLNALKDCWLSLTAVLKGNKEVAEAKDLIKSKLEAK